MDKTEKLLRMMEHPTQYSDEQWQELLADEECRELYEATRLSADAFAMADAQEKMANGIKDEEWQRFEAEHLNAEPLNAERHSSLFTIHDPFKKIAAVFIGVLMLSGIAYAAVHMINQHIGGDQQSPTREAQMTHSPLQKTDEQPTDSTTMMPVIYEDAELATILNDIATFYQCETVYKKEACKHIRLYFTWDKKQTIDDVIDTFNKFERIHITRENKKLIVE